MRKSISILLMLAACMIAGKSYAQMPKRSHFALGIMFDQARENNRLGSDAKFRRAEKQNGTTVALFYEFDFKKWRSVDIGFETGLTYCYHKGKSSDTRIIGAFQSNLSTIHRRHDFSIPLRLVYRQLIARDTYFTVYFGPQFQFSASNKAVETETRLSAQGQTEYKTTYNLLKNDEANLYTRSEVTDEIDQKAPVYGNVRPFNFQLGLGASLQFHEIQIRGGYDWGLNNLFANTSTATNLKSWTLADRVDQWYIGMVFFFPEKKSPW